MDGPPLFQMNTSNRAQLPLFLRHPDIGSVSDLVGRMLDLRI